MTPDSAALLDRADAGSAAWWADVARAGTPLLGAAAGGEVELTFVWRGDAACAAVYLDVYSHTPHPTRGPTGLRRRPGTDVWMWRTRLPIDWRGSYVFVPAGPDETSAPDAGRGALRAWWIRLLGTRASADPFNRGPAYRGGGGTPLSPLLLPRAPVHPAWRAPLPETVATTPYRWRSSLLDDGYDVWLLRAGAAPPDAPLVVLLDGRCWAEALPIAGALGRCTSDGQLPPAVYVLIDAGPPARRGRDLPCSAPFWDAVVTELLPQLRALAPFTLEPVRTIVAGQSYGGLAAVYAALAHPERFGRALAQSGSFWWPDPAQTQGAGWLGEQVAQGLGGRRPLDFDLEVGIYETDMTGVTRDMARALARAGHRVRHRRYRGGHDPLCWRDGLLRGLSRLCATIDYQENA